MKFKNKGQHFFCTEILYKLAKITHPPFSADNSQAKLFTVRSPVLCLWCLGFNPLSRLIWNIFGNITFLNFTT